MDSLKGAKEPWVSILFFLPAVFYSFLQAFIFKMKFLDFIRESIIPERTFMQFDYTSSAFDCLWLLHNISNMRLKNEHKPTLLLVTDMGLGSSLKPMAAESNQIA